MAWDEQAARSMQQGLHTYSQKASLVGFVVLDLLGFIILHPQAATETYLMVVLLLYCVLCYLLLCAHRLSIRITGAGLYICEIQTPMPEKEEGHGSWEVEENWETAD